MIIQLKEKSFVRYIFR